MKTNIAMVNNVQTRRVKQRDTQEKKTGAVNNKLKKKNQHF